MALQITNTDNVTDDATLELDGASGIAAATHNGTTYLYVTGAVDNGLSAFSVAPGGTLSNVANIPDDATLRLTSANAADTVSFAGHTFLLATGFFDLGLSVFEVTSNGTLVNTDNVADDATLRILPPQDVAAAEVGGTPYVFVTGFGDDGISVFALGIDGRLSNRANVVDDATLELDGASNVAIAQVGASTYLFATGAVDNGVSVFRVAADGALTGVDNVGDTAGLALAGAAGMTTAVVNGTRYLFVTGGADDGVSVFSVAADGALTNVDNVFDDATLGLDGGSAATTALIGSTTYLFVIGRVDGAVAVFEVAADGTLSHVTNVNDPALELNGAIDLTTAVVGGTTYLFTTGHTDDGVSVFSLTDSAPTLTIISDGGGDLANVSLPENTTAVTTVVALDPSSSGPAYSIIGGIDAARFQIDSASGVLSFLTAPNFEAPTDAGRNNTYVVEVRASAGNETDEQTITVEVADVAEQGPVLPPVITSNGGGDTALIAVDENTAAVTIVTAIDPGNIGGLSYSISGGADAALFEIDAMSGVLSFLAAPDFEAPADAGGDNSYEVEVQASAGSQADHQAITVNVVDVPEIGPIGSPADVPLGDILWRHSDGTLVTANGELGVLDDPWQVGDAADLDRDGDADILLRRDDGALAVWELAGGAFLAEHDFGMVGALWEIAGTGDFDRDGDADVLWRHRDGAVTIWEMENGGYVVNHNLPDAAPTWEITATGDFDRDGDADILWQHRDGAVVTWEMEDGEFVANHHLPDVATTWRSAGTGDFDRDGDADIAWRHQDGAVVTWEMHDGAFVVNHNLASVAVTWRIQGSEDFDSDGDADILWRHADGDVVTWEMQNGAFVMNHNHGVVPNAWQIVRTGEFDTL